MIVIILLTKYGNKNKNYYRLIKKILLRRLGKSIIYYINIYIYIIIFQIMDSSHWKHISYNQIYI